MILNPEITQNKQKTTENQKVPKHKLSGAQFLHWACQEGRLPTTSII